MMNEQSLCVEGSHTNYYMTTEFGGFSTFSNWVDGVESYSVSGVSDFGSVGSSTIDYIERSAPGFLEESASLDSLLVDIVEPVAFTFPELILPVAGFAALVGLEQWLSRKETKPRPQASVDKVPITTNNVPGGVPMLNPRWELGPPRSTRRRRR